MNFDELNEIVAKEAGIDICPVCGTPFERRHKAQKTCGTDECKRLYKNNYLRERRKRLMEEDIEAYRKKRRETQRKSRRKQRELELAEKNLEKAQEYWDKRAERHIETDGIEYGKKQMERTLAMIPKIDVSGFGKEQTK